MIFSESLPALQALEKIKLILLSIHIEDMLYRTDVDQKEIVLKRFPGCVGVRGNEAAGRADTLLAHLHVVGMLRLTFLT